MLMNSGICLTALLVGLCSAATMPPVRCPANEEDNECGDYCEQKCSQVNQPDVCDHTRCPGPPACTCQRNHYRHDVTGRCVTAANCPSQRGRSRCPPNEEWNECGDHCERSCLLVNEDDACDYSCPGPPKCTCQRNHFRHNLNGMCVTDAVCYKAWRQIKAAEKTGSTTTGGSSECGHHEILNKCGNWCEGKCDAIGEPCEYACLGPTQCACINGYYRDFFGRCVAASECTDFRHALPDADDETAEGKPKVKGKVKKPGAALKSLEEAPDVKEVEAGCSDDHEYCAYWAAIGECSENEKYMKKICKASCDLCETEAAPDCSKMTDVSGAATCSTWQELGLCEKENSVKYVYCQKTCQCTS